MAAERSPGSGDPRAREAELSRRLKNLGDRLGTLAPKRPAGDETGDGTRDASARGSNLARALRLSSEFVGGIVVGGVIGWFFDYATGWSPWGMIVFVLLGFAAGTLNVMRSAGLVSPRDGNANPK